MNGQKILLWRVLQKITSCHSFFGKLEGKRRTGGYF